MPRVDRPDGTRIHWEERGEGPLVVLASYWSMHPSAFQEIGDELARDHRVVRYDDRGSGESSRSGPYDLDTAAGDLEAVIEAADGPAVVLSTADGVNRAVRVAARRPELVAGAIGVGGVPLGIDAFADTEALVGSDTVVGALIQQVETDYRGALRALLGATNQQMSEEELRDRVNMQAAYSPHDAATARLRAWAADHPLEPARAAGDRLWALVSESLAGGWFPAGDEMAAVVRRMLPEANIVHVDDGMVSRPDQTAAVVRRITADVRGAPAGRK